MRFSKQTYVCGCAAFILGVYLLPVHTTATQPIHAVPEVVAELDETDIIYYTRNDWRNYIPVVNEEYKTVFFFIGKCASSEWKRMFVRMMGSPNWCAKSIHKKEVSGLKWLNDYSLEEAQDIMTSPEWTRAIFVRNPKERLLSAFLDKVVSHSGHFVADICKTYERKGYNRKQCERNHLHFKFFLTRITTYISNNVHWMQIYDQIDEKWWPYINFVGNVSNLSEDAKAFLKLIISDKTDVSAWESWGKTGWSDHERDCKVIGTMPFLVKGDRDERHETDAHEKLEEYYTPWLEKFVETTYARDLDNPYFQFTPLEIYPHTQKADFEEDKI